MWTYEQATGKLSHDGADVATGYSGAGDGKNNPADEAIQGVGPIPTGSYTIGQPYDTTTHGPFVMRLTPAADNQMDGRSGFLMHGDNATHTASQGCIIMPRNVREQVAASGDMDLTVV